MSNIFSKDAGRYLGIYFIYIDQNNSNVQQKMFTNTFTSGTYVLYPYLLFFIYLLWLFIIIYCIDVSCCVYCNLQICKQLCFNYWPEFLCLSPPFQKHGGTASFLLITVLRSCWQKEILSITLVDVGSEHAFNGSKIYSQESLWSWRWSWPSSYTYVWMDIG